MQQDLTTPDAASGRCVLIAAGARPGRRLERALVFAADRAETGSPAGARARPRPDRIHTCGIADHRADFRSASRCAAPMPALELQIRRSRRSRSRRADIVVAAQVWQPTLLIAEFHGPLTVGEPGQPAVATANWKLAQASVRGMPTEPEQVSIVLDAGRLDRIDAPVRWRRSRAPTASRCTARARTRFRRRQSAVDVVVRVAAGTVPLAASVRRGTARRRHRRGAARLEGSAAEAVAGWLREMQAAGGRHRDHQRAPAAGRDASR